jgi:hypothetical protein
MVGKGAMAMTKKPRLRTARKARTESSHGGISVRLVQVGDDAERRRDEAFR